MSLATTLVFSQHGENRHLPSIQPFSECVRESWNQFVQTCPQATFFHRIEWKDIIEDVFGHRTHFLYAQENDRLTGILPLAEVKSLLFGHAFVSLPFCVYSGVAASNSAAAEALILAAEKLARTQGADHLELRHVNPYRPTWPTQDLYVSFRKEISADSEENMKAIPRKQRAMVRKGIKAGLNSHLDDTVDRFFALYADNVHRHGTPAFSKRYFSELRRKFGSDCEILTVTDPDGTPVSSVMTFYFRDEVLPYYAGDADVARELAANDFKYWELMRRASERGYFIFDYGRSKQGTGSFDFKKNWGFEPVTLHYEYALFRKDTVPQHNPLNPKYQALIGLWRRLPRAVVNKLGPHIVRHLG